MNKMEKLVEEFGNFVNSLSDFELRELAESRLDVRHDVSFFLATRSGSGNGVSVFNSEGMGDQLISAGLMKKWLISESENLLQELCYGF